MDYRLPPHPKRAHWLFRNAYYLIRDRLAFFIESRQEMGHIYTVTAVSRNLMVVTHPDYVKRILVDNNKNYVKSFAYNKIRFLLGNGLLTSEGDFWRTQRRLIQPAFYKEKLLEIGQVMIERTDVFFEEWAKKGSHTVNFSFEMNKVALEVVTQALFFSEIGNEVSVGEISSLVTNAIEGGSEMIDALFSFPLWVPTPKNVRLRKTIAALDKVIYEILEKRRGSNGGQQDLLSLLMDAKDEDTNEQMSNLQLRDEVMTLFMAGHETSANALAWAGYLIVEHPEVQTRLRAEIAEVLGNEPLTVAHLPKFVYTKQIIEEVLRLYPPAWAVGRRNLEADKFGEYEVPPNYNIALPIYVIHRDADWWENPEAFVPERFAPDAPKAYPRYAYLPFGGGPRLCIGNHFALMEMQIVLIRLFQRFDLRYEGSQPPVPEALITMRPKDNIEMKVAKRI